MSDKTFEVYLAYEDYDGVIKEESVRVIKEGENYRVDSIPLFSSNLAVGDLVDVECEDGKLYFFDLIKASGHSTVQIVFFDHKARSAVIEALSEFGCGYAGTSALNYLSVDIPGNVCYSAVRSILESYARKGVVDFKEACLGSRPGTK